VAGSAVTGSASELAGRDRQGWRNEPKANHVLERLAASSFRQDEGGLIAWHFDCLLAAKSRTVVCGRFGEPNVGPEQFIA
jgi:hypothetical protein